MNRSSITCTLPAPTPNEGLPEEYADFTIGIPPVATVTSHMDIRACVLVIEGSRTTCTIPSGTPRGLSTSLIISTASEEQYFAFGCGAIMMAFWGILDKFDTLVNSISEGLPREIELRRKQYEYYREQLLSFPEYKVSLDRKSVV